MRKYFCFVFVQLKLFLRSYSFLIFNLSHFSGPKFVLGYVTKEKENIWDIVLVISYQWLREDVPNLFLPAKREEMKIKKNKLGLYLAKLSSS